MYLHHPFTSKILNMLDSGIIGEVRSIQGHYCASIAQFVNPESKGALYNLGCYPASLLHLIMQHCFGEKSFDNYTITASGRRGADGNVCESAATLQFENGVVCQLHTAEDYGLHSGFTILGTEGLYTANIESVAAGGNRKPDHHTEIRATGRNRRSRSGRGCFPISSQKDSRIS